MNMMKDAELPLDDKTRLYDKISAEVLPERVTGSSLASRHEAWSGREVFSTRPEAPSTYNVSLNSVVGAASELLSHVVRLKHWEKFEDLKALNQQLNECVKRFGNLAEAAGIDESERVTARYILCTVVDEAVVTTTWGNESEWAQMSLLSANHNETFGGEKFFQLLERLSKNPVKHLQMLELMYVCLALGFEGKHRVNGRNKQKIVEIRDALYRQIRQLRGDVPRELSPHWEGLEYRRQRPVRIIPWWAVTVFVVLSMGVMYSGFSWVLGEQRESVLQPYLSLESVLDQSSSRYRDVS